jgi:hypothetical protein
MSLALQTCFDSTSMVPEPTSIHPNPVACFFPLQFCFSQHIFGVDLQFVSVQPHVMLAMREKLA